MKAMRRIAAKIAGVSLATVMAFGGATAFAAENGDEVYNGSAHIKEHGVIPISYSPYHEATISFTVPDDGIYTIVCTDTLPTFQKVLTVYDCNGNILVPQNYWSDEPITRYVELYSGVAYAADIGITFLGRVYHQDEIDVNLTVTLTRKYEEESTSIVPYMEGHFAPGMPYAPGMPLGLELPRRGGNVEAEQTPVIPSMPDIVIDAQPETNITFNMYSDCSEAEQTPVIPSMPDIVIDAEPETPVTFTMLISAEPEIDEEPVEIIDVDEEPAEIVTIAEAEEATAETVESIAPVFSLTAEQMRTLAVRNFVGHLYTDGLGRRATESEITEWTDKLMSGNITATDAASQILTSSELNDHNFDNEQIAAILDEVFGTDSESDTLAQLNGGASVASVIEQLAGTDNWASKCAFYGVNV